MTTDPNDFAAIMAKAEERHRHEMSVLKEAMQIAKRLNGESESAGATANANPAPSVKVEVNGVRQRRKPQLQTQPQSNAPVATGLTETVREAIESSKSDFTIRTLAECITTLKPELAESKHFMVGISSILSRELKRGRIHLVSRGSAGKPSLYSKQGPLFA